MALVLEIPWGIIILYHCLRVQIENVLAGEIRLSLLLHKGSAQSFIWNFSIPKLRSISQILMGAVS